MGMPSQRPRSPLTPLTTNRAIHVIDIENLVGTPNLTKTDVDLIRRRMGHVMPRSPGDHDVLACSHHGLLAAATGWPQARYLIRSGHDGPDEALIEVLQSERVADRFNNVVIGSGDGVFAFAAAALASHGCHVSVVARPGSLSAQLKLAAHEVHLLPVSPRVGPASRRAA